MIILTFSLEPRFDRRLQPRPRAWHHALWWGSCWRSRPLCRPSLMASWLQEVGWGTRNAVYTLYFENENQQNICSLNSLISSFFEHGNKFQVKTPLKRGRGWDHRRAHRGARYYQEQGRLGFTIQYHHSINTLYSPLSDNTLIYYRAPPFFFVCRKKQIKFPIHKTETLFTIFWNFNFRLLSEALIMIEKWRLTLYSQSS